MFGKVVAGAASVCALWSLLVVGEARAFPGGNRRSGSQRSHQQSAGLRLAAPRMPAWPPRRPSRQLSAPGSREVAQAGSFEDAFMVDTSMVYGPAAGDQRLPAIASDGSGWLVVWCDWRDYTLRAGRLDATGVLLDTGGVVIGNISDHTECQADVTFDGLNYLVVWETGYEYESDVRAAHISPAGVLLDTFAVSAEQEGQCKPGVASGGDTSLVVWVDTRDYETNLYAARVISSGGVIDPAGFLVAPINESYSSQLSVEYGDGEFLVVWSDYTGDTIWTQSIFAVRVGVDGALRDTGAIRLNTSGFDAAAPTVAFGDTFFLVAWQESDVSSMNVVGRRVTTGGIALDPSCIRIAPFSNEQQEAAATFDGTNFLVTWVDYDYNSYAQTIRARRVTTGGNPLDPNQIRICPNQTSTGGPAACYSGADFVVAWNCYGAQDADVYCVRLSSAGVVRDPDGIVLPLGVESQKSPAVAFDGVNYLAVWCEHGSEGLYDVRGARVTPSGAVLDPRGFSIGEGTVLGYLAVAYGHGEHLVVWNSGDPYSDSTALAAARVLPDGTVVDTLPILLGTGTGYDVAPDAAFDGNNFLVVWCSPMDSVYGVYGARISSDGTVLDPNGFLISDGAGIDLLPAVAFDSANYVVTWTRSDNYADVCCALVSPAGSIVAPTTLVSGDTGDQVYPAVACGPTSSLVIWMDDHINGTYYDIRAARVSHSGEVLDPEGIPVTNSSYDERMPEIVYGGGMYRSFWSRWSQDSACYCGAMLDTAGHTLSWFRPFGRADDGVYYYGGNSIRAAAGSAVDAFAVYQSWTDEAGGRQYGNYRVWGKMGPFDGVDEAPHAGLRTTEPFGTIVRGVLFLPGDMTQTSDRAPRPILLDITGRKVTDLRPGANDVSRLAPGVYFVHSTFDNRQSKMTKVIVTR
jgi:hypothetical protein